MSSSSNSTNPTQPQQRSDQPGLVSGHAEYIKGAAESVIGSVTGSHAWTTSGEQDKAHAKSQLQAASEGRDPSKAGYGAAEEMAGKVTGCEWMQKEGAASKSHHE